MDDPATGAVEALATTATAGAEPWPKELDPVRLVDQVTAAYNALLAVVWAALIPQAWYSIWLFAAHAAAAAMPWLLRRTHGRLSPVGRVLRDIYPLIWILAFWTELDFIRRLLHDASFDRVVGALDLSIFGTHLDAVFLPNASALWFSELMYFAYFGYYLIVVLPLLYMAIRGSPEMKRDMTFRIVLVYLACFFVYIVFPVDGPHWLSEPYQGDFQQGFFYKLEQLLQGQGSSLGASFPSSHVAASVTMALLGYRWFSRPVALLLAAGALGVVVSTVYTQNHFAIDSLAGILWAFWIQLMVAPALMRWWERRVEDRALSGRRGGSSSGAGVSDPTLTASP